MVFESSAESEQQRSEQQQRAGRLRDAALADAALDAVLRRDYPGRHDVLDALWWRAHPLTDTPAGRPDPAGELPALQAAVYSRARSAESASGDVQRLTTLQQALGRDSADLDAFLDQYPTREAAALAETGPLPSALAGMVAGDATEIEVNAGPETGVGPESPAPQRLRGPRGTALLLAAGAAAGVLAVLVLQATVLAGATDAPGATTSTAGASETAGPTPSAGNLLGVFDQPEFVPDDTTPALGGEYTSVHSLFGPVLETGLPYSVFAARLRDDQYCLILRNADLTGTSACSTLDEITRSGLHLNATVMGALDSADPLTASVTYDQLIDVSVDWTADGMSSSSGPHPSADR